MIRTERLLLRPARQSDLEPLHAMFSDPRAMRYWAWPAYQDLSRTQAFLDAFMAPDPKRQYEFILDLDGTCIGKAGVWGAPEIGYIVDPKHWRQGYVQEALEAIIPRAFAALPDHDRLTAEVDPRNRGSIKLLEKLGFHRVRLVQKNFLYGHREWCDTAYYELPRRS